jgi:hypothetical protein
LIDFQGNDPITPQQHTLMELHELIHLFVIDAGFYDISQLHDIYLDHALIAILVER